MSYKVTISGGTILEECIEHVSFSTETTKDYNSRHTSPRNSMIITGKVDTDESTVSLYNWALLSGTNPDCYKEVTVEQYQKELLVREVTFLKAFVIDYSENYSNYSGVGTFTLYLRQFYNKEIEVTSEETTKSNTVSEVANEIKETIEEAATVMEIVPITKTIKSSKSAKITDIINKNKTQKSNNKGTRLPKSNGKWSGKEGNSAWIPDKDFVPTNKKTNPNKLSWNQISQKHGGVDRINFEDNKPDFTTISKGKVEIVDFGTDRNGSDGNFKKADKKLAEQRGCTEREVKKWRKKNIYTWHEAEDCKTMYKVPNEIHGNVPHKGGISNAKKLKTERTVIFDE